MTQKHLKVHRSKSVAVPFYMWGDHYMFVRGGFGKYKHLNYFVDSGLVALHDSHGKTRQACFVTTPEQYKKWGVNEDLMAQTYFECELPISLGPLEQANQYFTTEPLGSPKEFGGVSIDGLISHAFLKEYVWTLDFDRMRYVFSNPVPSP